MTPRPDGSQVSDDFQVPSGSQASDDFQPDFLVSDDFQASDDKRQISR